MKSLLVILVLVCLSSNVASYDKKLGCYWTSENYQALPLSQIDVTHCTHMFFRLYKVDASGNITSMEAANELNMMELRRQNPFVKIFASILVNHVYEDIYAIIASDADKLSNFAKNVIALSFGNGFDGIDIDWGTSDRKNYVNALRVLKSELSLYGKLLSTVIFGSPESASEASQICLSVDILNVNLFGNAGDQNIKTKIDSPSQDIYDVSNAYINAGCPAKKIFAGPTSYGYNLVLNDPTNTAIGASYVFRSYAVFYRDICMRLKQPGWTTERFDHSPYTYKSQDWMTYDDVESIEHKATIVGELGLGGLFFYMPDRDDHSDTCGTGKFPLIQAAYRGLGISMNENLPPMCGIFEYSAVPGNCFKYQHCENGQFQCPNGLSWRQGKIGCVPIYSNPDCFSPALADFIRRLFNV